jgi:hypothetical protein
MDNQQITGKMLEFNKSVFDSTFKMIIAIQDQSECMLTSFMDKATWLPDDGKKAITDWISTYKKARNDFQAVADDKYEKVANYFSKIENTANATTKK